MLGGHERHTRRELAALLGIGRQVGPHDEQLPLHGEQVGRHHLVIGERPGQTQDRHGFVGGAVGLGDQVILRDAPSVQEPGGTVVAGLGVDAGHGPLA